MGKASTAKRAVAREHIEYEIDMLEYCAVNLVPMPPPGPQRNLLLEGFALHARGLIQFLFPERKKRNRDDMAADHHVGNVAAWRAARGPYQSLSVGLRRVIRRVGSEVAHLSYERVGVTPKQKEWDVSALAAELRALIGLYRQHEVVRIRAQSMGSLTGTDSLHITTARLPRIDLRLDLKGVGATGPVGPLDIVKKI